MERASSGSMARTGKSWGSSILPASTTLNSWARRLANSPGEADPATLLSWSNESKNKTGNRPVLSVNMRVRAWFQSEAMSPLIHPATSPGAGMSHLQPGLAVAGEALIHVEHGEGLQVVPDDPALSAGFGKQHRAGMGNHPLVQVVLSGNEQGLSVFSQGADRGQAAKGRPAKSGRPDVKHTWICTG